MNGQEHYRVAEEILAKLTDEAATIAASERVFTTTEAREIHAGRTEALAAAQVHATLALARATAGENL